MFSLCVNVLDVHWPVNLRRSGAIKFAAGPILSVFFALIVHSELKSVHPGFPVAFIFLSTS